MPGEAGGDALFGICLCCMFAVAVSGKALVLAALPLVAAAVARWVLAVGVSYRFCLVAG